MPQLLIELLAAGFTGTLRLQRARTTKSVRFQQGAPVASESNVPGEQLAALLRDAGTIDESAHDQVVAYAAEKNCKQQVALLALKLLDPKQLFLTLKDQIGACLISCIAWPDGQFEFEPGEAIASDVQMLRCDPYSLIQEGISTHWDPQRLLADLGPQLDRYAKQTPTYLAIAARFKLDAEVGRLATALDGSKTLGQAMGIRGSQPATLAAAWVLAAGGLLCFSDAPMPVASQLGEAEPAGPEIEIEVRKPVGGRAKPTASEKADTDAKSEDRRAKQDKKAAQVRAEIEQKLERLGELEHYAVLGVEADAEASAIRRAYLVAAKRYHPDALARMSLDDIKEQASQLFARISEAYEVLSDPDERQHYDDSLLDDGPEIDAAVLAQAETFYRKGEILLKMGDFRGALEYLQNAVQVWPDEVAYQSDLGWVYYKKQPQELEPARKHLGKALELDPEHALTLYRMSFTLRALGQESAAAEHLERAERFDPEVAS